MTLDCVDTGRAPLPPNEDERLRAVHRQGLLDSDPDPRFDRIARVATHVLRVPIALVTLVDADRQVFTAKCGIDITETSRDVAFCAHTILSDEILEVRDTLKDARFARNPLVLGPPFIRYYIGKPLVDRNGQRLGTVCAIDTAPRPPLDAGLRAVLTDLAGTAMDLMESRLRDLEADNARQQAVRMAAMKDEYLAAMAHELRTPVNAVAGFGELLKATGAEAALSDRQRSYMNTLLESADYLGLLVRETLATQTRERASDGPTMQAVPVAPALSVTKRLMAPLAAKQGLTLTLDKPPDSVCVWGDPLQLRQVLINLVSNAVKYNRPEGRVHLAATPDDKTVSIVCEDTGKGIPEPEIPKLFRPFHRVAANSDGIEGSGLGLRITKRLVMMMGGRISVFSRVNEGSTFTVTLSRAPGP
ncbi:HAMP domain-containing sensor histidine kinase [uncultured Rhodospira sp.]|uniref:sensor histidine kinase n=1 Tax=uncultured Rhodospira sp. TaxID=1936189 RepID=UPI002618DCB2|nr:GAF domain-containing sensor histidine kinase [uncultured Rhodospira sp.]